MIKSSLFSALAASALLAGIAAAQDTLSPFNGPIKYGHHDMATGVTTLYDTDPSLNPASPGDSNPSILWDNSTIGGSFSTGSGNAVATHHHMGWGVANYGGLGATINEFRIAYATSVTAAEGTIAMHIRIYDGALGFGNQGTVNPNGDLIITGLPNSAGGGFEGYIIDVTPVTPIVMADGPFGYSYNSDASFTNGTTKLTGPLLCIAPVGPGVTPNYDRYLESTNAYVNTFFFAAPNIGVFAMRLTGRTNAPPPPTAWANYGTKSGVEFTGAGSATPGSVDNVLSITSTPGKKAILVAGLVQSELVNTSLGLTFYALPWNIMVPDLQLSALNGTLDVPAALPLDVPPGTKLYMQVFAQKANNTYGKYSEGLELTVQ
jgi:hypothetical protein